MDTLKNEFQQVNPAAHSRLTPAGSADECATQLTRLPCCPSTIYVEASTVLQLQAGLLEPDRFRVFAGSVRFGSEPGRTGLGPEPGESSHSVAVCESICLIFWELLRI